MRKLIVFTVRHLVMAGQLLRRRLWWFAAAGTLLFVLIAGPPMYAVAASRGDMYTLHDVPHRDVAVVFGAGLQQDHKPSSYLESRLKTAAELYKAGKVKVLLLSGDNSAIQYDEPTAMKQFVIDLGVPAEQIVLDYAGFSTYDTCHRAKAIFDVKSAILVTHGYHLPRALMTCRAFGIDSVGVRAQQKSSAYSKNYLFREVLALDKAALEVTLKPEPKFLGKKEPGITAALSR